ncbi:MAG: hypothetical protein M0Q91_12190 [Methanoregula sp.]|nr:hypothetical protein [Methanoregula sp.]
MEVMGYIIIAVLIGVLIWAIYQLIYIDRKIKKSQKDRKELFRVLDEQRSKNNALLEWFHDGGICPRCGCTESEVSPKPHRCERCGTWFNKTHKIRKCTGCGFCMEVSYE